MKTKFALISPVAPPSWSGQAIVIGRILKDVDPTGYCIVTRRYPGQEDQDFINPLGADYFHLPPDRLATVGPGWSAGKRKWRMRANILQLAWKLIRIFRQNQVKDVVAATADHAMMPAAFLAAKLCGARFYPYLFDDYTFQWPDDLMREMAGGWEARIFRGSSGIIAPNEFLVREIEKRHGLTPSIVRNPAEAGEAPAPKSRDDGEVHIVFTGAVYHVNFGAFKNLIACFRDPELSRVKLHIYTAVEEQVLIDQGICGDQVIYHGHVPPDEVGAVQAGADILFLPFALDMLPEIVKTSCPGKLADYLMSGTPILAQASGQSFVYWYLNQHECGIAVDDNNPGAMTRAIKMLCADADLRNRLGENARQRALTDFDPQKAGQDFLRVLGRET